MSSAALSTAISQCRKRLHDHPVEGGRITYGSEEDMDQNSGRRFRGCLEGTSGSRLYLEYVDAAESIEC